MTNPPEASRGTEEMLDLSRWGMRFTNRETESAYRVRHIEQAVPFNRAGLIAPIFIWSIVVALCLGLHTLLSWVPVILFVMLPVVVAALLTTYVRALRGVMLWSGMAANTLAGFLVVGLGREHVVGLGVETGLAALLVANYFGFASLRALPLQAVVAIAPYMAVEVLVLAQDMRAGTLGVAAFAWDTFLLTTGFTGGFTINVVFDIVSRRSYRQERIIEAQKDTIARERARSEALLKNELSHQVAERSRELGDALARVGAPKTVSVPVVGERFDTRYRVVRTLGEGGMGAVFEVERVTDGQRLALKVVTGNVSGAMAARFAREAEIGARVRHANLISIVDVGVSEGGAPFLVMELVQGGSLEGLRARFGEPAWGLPILKQIAQGLSVLHEAGSSTATSSPGTSFSTTTSTVQRGPRSRTSGSPASASSMRSRRSIQRDRRRGWWPLPGRWTSPAPESSSGLRSTWRPKPRAAGRASTALPTCLPWGSLRTRWSPGVRRSTLRPCSWRSPGGRASATGPHGALRFDRGS